MSFDISLTSGMRADLTSLQATAQLLNRTQQRLSSGKAVNSAVDNPSAFFAAQDHLNHASDLSSRKADMGEAIQAVNAANTGITNITTLINQAQGLVQSAQSANATTRANLAAQFNTLRTQIDQLASDSGYNGKNFLQHDSLNVLFNETGSSFLTVTGFYANSSGLGITTAAIGTGTVAVAHTAEALGSNMASAQVVNLAHSGIVQSSGVSVTQSLTGMAASAAIASNASATALSGKSVALGHVGLASNVVVYENLRVQSGVLAAGSAATGASATLANAPLGTATVVKYTYSNQTASSWINSNASASAVSGSIVALGHIGLPSNVVVFEKLRVSAQLFAASGATSGASATVAHLPVGSYTIATLTGTALSAGSDYTAYTVSGALHIKMLNGTTTSAVEIVYHYNKSLALTTDYTISTGGLATAARITFAHSFSTASAIGVTYSVVSQTATTLQAGQDYTAYTVSGNTHIAMLTAATGGIRVTYNYARNLTLTTDYTVTSGGLSTAATITFARSFATASAIGVTYDVKSKVASANYTVGTGGNSTAGAITFDHAVTGSVQVTYSTTAGAAWASNDALQVDIANLNTAISTLRTQASTMAANLSVITTRQTWSQAMINNLQTGSDNLTLADMNEEGANMLALQTRQQLGVQALSLASQSNQSVMRLFG